MKRFWIALVLFAAALAFGRSVGAETLDLDLDTLPGHFSSLTVRDIKPAGEISLSATVTDLRVHPNWLPGFNVYLRVGKFYGGLFFAFQRNASVGTAVMKVTEGAKVLSEMPFAVTVAPNRPVDIVLRWRADRSVQAFVGGIASPTVVLPVAADELVVGDSTAEVKFTNLRLK